MRTSKFTFITETSAFPFAENVGASSRKRILNGKKLTNKFLIIVE